MGILVATYIGMLERIEIPITTPKVSLSVATTGMTVVTVLV